MYRAALATDRAHPDGYFDDLPLVAALARRGVDATWVPWDADQDWSAFDVVLIRSTWDYPARHADFSRWIDELAVPLWNPADIVTWNSRKTYLFDLAAWGVPIIPTVPLAPTEDLAGALLALGWDEAVVKPVVGAGGRSTWRVNEGNAAVVNTFLRSLGQPMLLQPFVPEFGQDGEWSLVFIDGSLSHTLRKTAAPGEFRVQEVHGGTVRVEAASDAMVAVAQDVLAAVGEPLPYARVDLVDGPSGPRLVEAELIEPELFFRMAPGAADALAEALLRRLG